WPLVGEQMATAAAELAHVHRLLHNSISATPGPSCDLFACGRILLQCFCQGKEAVPSLSLERFQVALAVWVGARCPRTQDRYDLLWAFNELRQEKPEQGEDLASIENVGIRRAIGRCIKRSRYSRLGCCEEAADLLATATLWLNMSAEFLRSHEVAVEEASRKQMLERFYSDAHAKLDKEESCRPNSSTAPDLLHALEESSGREELSAIWNLCSCELGRSHVARIIEVLKGWTQRRSIQAVCFATFSENLPEDLQDAFCELFSHEHELHSGERHASPAPLPRKAPAQRRAIDKLHHGKTYAAVADDQERPIQLFLQDVALPARALPTGQFSVEELLRRHSLWLAVNFVSELDLTPSTSAFCEVKPLSVGTAPGAMRVLSFAVSRSRILTSLSLRSSDIDDEGGLLLASALSECHSLQRLDLSDNDLGPRAAFKVLQAAEQNLTTLDLSRNRLGCAGARAIADALGSCQKLLELRLCKNGLGQEGGEALAEGLLSNTVLQDLDLADNEVNLPTATAILRAVNASRFLRRLRLDSNEPWYASGNEALIGAFTDQIASSCLESLSLRHCGLRSAGAGQLFDALAQNTSLRCLNVSWNGIRQEAAAKIAAALAAPNSALEELDLRDNHLGSQEALAASLWQVFVPMVKAGRDHRLVRRRTGSSHSAGASDEPPEPALPAIEGYRSTNSRLRIMHLANNGITTGGASRLAQLVPAFTGLEELVMYHNPLIGDSGAEALSKLLQPAPPARGLRRLSLAACGVGDVGCSALMGSLAKNQVLTSLDLSCNALTDACAPGIAEVLGFRDSALQVLNVAMNQLSTWGLCQLVDAAARRREGDIPEIDVSCQDSPRADDEVELAASNEALSKFKGLR
ncbi:unnamed protein product, partial [Polarella glacialis]